MSFKNFTAGVTLYGLSIRLGIPVISADKQGINIPYSGASSPQSSSVSLVKYKYSVDRGVTYSDMTPVSSADITGLTFTESGQSGTFHWDARKDIGSEIYNTNIRIVLQASEFGLTSTEVSRSFIIPRSMVNLTTLRERQAFPVGYEGIPGDTFAQSKLPKSK